MKIESTHRKLQLVKPVALVFLAVFTLVISSSVFGIVGATGTRSTAANTDNVPPTVSIKKPLQGQTLYMGYPYILESDSFDADMFSSLPCNKMQWTSSNATDVFVPNPGCNPKITFGSLGMRTITLIGTDALGATGQATVTINIANAPLNTAPVVTILNPSNNSYLTPSNLMLLMGTAKDPDGKSPISYKWVLEQNGSQIQLGVTSSASGGQSLIWWKPSNNVPFHCGGSTVRLYLYATDVSGKTGSAYVDLTIGYPTC